MSVLAGLRLAVGLLTVVPVRPPEQIGRAEARTAMLLAPLAVVPVALGAAGLGWAATALGMPASLAGTLLVAGLAFGTRAMHLDGLADTTDGLGSGKAADGALEIMRRGDVGPMGAVSLAVVLLAQAVSAGAVLARPHGWLAAALLVCGSRVALALGCARGVPAARADGLGALVAGSVPVVAAVTGWLVLAAAWLVAGVPSGRPWWVPVAGCVLAVLACAWLLRRCIRRLGGITGDVLGALVEVALTVLLVVAAVG